MQTSKRPPPSTLLLHSLEREGPGAFLISPSEAGGIPGSRLQAGPAPWVWARWGPQPRSDQMVAQSHRQPLRPSQPEVSVTWPHTGLLVCTCLGTLGSHWRLML